MTRFLIDLRKMEVSEFWPTMGKAHFGVEHPPKTCNC